MPSFSPRMVAVCSDFPHVENHMVADASSPMLRSDAAAPSATCCCPRRVRPFSMMSSLVTGLERTMSAASCMLSPGRTRK
jgi:hypothetical protein